MRGTASVLASALLALLLTRGAAAAPTACPEHFAGGQAPDIVSAPLARDTHALCFLGYANLASGVSRTGLYSALRLTRERVRDARGDVRENAFHEEKRIPTRARARLADYTRSGYDRGHIAPNGDFPEPEQARESFSLANIAPQVPEHNRGIWRLIEEAVRRLASQRGELFVVTGVAFQPDENGDIASLKGRVLVPSHYWKAVYDPFRRAAAAYYSRNAPEQEYEVISIAELRERVGVDPFPSMPETAKQRALPLPDPTERTATGRRSRNQG
ncbi:MAG TPA: DNA/RNA non-specific endonuclease [Azospirillaceae bacterium]|nr:DNA/RNA non-specific endonuclease [Azospirillaceae bacterium]